MLSKLNMLKNPDQEHEWQKSEMGDNLKDTQESFRILVERPHHLYKRSSTAYSVSYTQSLSNNYLGKSILK